MQFSIVHYPENQGELCHLKVAHYMIQIAAWVP
jgi:hypothetical protein